VKIQAFDAPPLPPFDPPTSASVPSPERATLEPNTADPLTLLAVSLWPFCFHVEPLRRKLQTAPAPLLSLGPLTSARFPSADSATSEPKLAKPTSPAGTRRAC
jgi:hypothetical protein